MLFRKKKNDIQKNPRKNVSRNEIQRLQGELVQAQAEIEDLIDKHQCYKTLSQKIIQKKEREMELKIEEIQKSGSTIISGLSIIDLH